MIPTQPVESIGTYAGGNPQYMTEPTGDDFANGVEPLDTLPAGWWNWLWNKITLNEGRTVTALDSLVNECLDVLNEAGIIADNTQTNQLKNSIKLIIQASTGLLSSLTTTNKATLVAAVNELNAAIGSLDDLESGVKTSIVLAINSVIDSKGQANGIASLDATGRIPYSQLPESAIEFKGTWNADTNIPTLTDGVGTNGDMYIVSVAGTWQKTVFYVGDRIIYNGNTQKWIRLGGGNVSSVNGQTGAVSLNGSNLHTGDDTTPTLNSAIETNTANIATNTADIATNKTNIETNTTDIATNKADIETNASSITAFKKLWRHELTRQKALFYLGNAMTSLGGANLGVDYEDQRNHIFIQKCTDTAGQYGTSGHIIGWNLTSRGRSKCFQTTFTNENMSARITRDDDILIFKSAAIILYKKSENYGTAHNGSLPSGVTQIVDMEESDSVYYLLDSSYQAWQSTDLTTWTLSFTMSGATAGRLLRLFDTVVYAFCVKTTSDSTTTYKLYAHFMDTGDTYTHSTYTTTSYVFSKSKAYSHMISTTEAIIVVSNSSACNLCILSRTSLLVSDYTGPFTAGSFTPQDYIPLGQGRDIILTSSASYQTHNGSSVCTISHNGYYYEGVGIFNVSGYSSEDSWLAPLVFTNSSNIIDLPVLSQGSWSSKSGGAYWFKELDTGLLFQFYYVFAYVPYDILEDIIFQRRSLEGLI